MGLAERGVPIAPSPCGTEDRAVSFPIRSQTYARSLNAESSCCATRNALCLLPSRSATLIRRPLVKCRTQYPKYSDYSKRFGVIRQHCAFDANDLTHEPAVHNCSSHSHGATDRAAIAFASNGPIHRRYPTKRWLRSRQSCALAWHTSSQSSRRRRQIVAGLHELLGSTDAHDEGRMARGLQAHDARVSNRPIEYELVDHIEQFDALGDSPRDSHVRVCGMLERTNICLHAAARRTLDAVVAKRNIRRSTFGELTLFS
jgi:hypothetical protein